LCLVIVYWFRLGSVRPLDLPDQAQIKITGRVIQQPYLKYSKQIVNVKGFLIKTEPFPAYFYGQKLVVVGKVRKRVLNRFMSQFSLSYPQIRIIKQSTGLADKFSFKRVLLGFKNSLVSQLQTLLPEPQASLLVGILLGSKQSMPEEFMQNLRRTGTIHIIVASGYNIAVVAGFLVSVLVLFCQRRLALVLAFLGIVAYTIMAGAEPPVVRAAIMGSLTYLAQFLGREKDALTSLFWAAVVMLLISPLILFDIGFQLSFLATAGILLINPFLQGKLFQVPILGEDLKVTLAAQAAVLPVLVFNFGQISLLSPLINALVLPITPPVMSLGAAVLGLGWLAKPLAQGLAWLVWLPLTYFVKLVEWFGQLPWINWQVGELNAWWVLGYYFVLGVWVVRKGKLISNF